TRDRVIMAARGARHDLTLSVTGPGSEVEDYIGRYDLTKFWPLRGHWGGEWASATGRYALTRFWPLGGKWVVELSSQIAYGQPMGDTTDLPPYKNFFAGGAESVRGYKPGRLGPRRALRDTAQ